MNREPHTSRRRFVGCVGFSSLLLLVTIVALVTWARLNPPTVKVTWVDEKVRFTNFTGQPVRIIGLALDRAGWRIAKLPEPLYCPSHVESIFVDPKALKWENLGAKEVIDPPTPGDRIFLILSPVEVK